MQLARCVTLRARSHLEVQAYHHLCYSVICIMASVIYNLANFHGHRPMPLQTLYQVISCHNINGGAKNIVVSCQSYESKGMVLSIDDAIACH